MADVGGANSNISFNVVSPYTSSFHDREGTGVASQAPVTHNTTSTEIVVPSDTQGVPGKVGDEEAQQASNPQLR